MSWTIRNTSPGVFTAMTADGATAGTATLADKLFGLPLQPGRLQAHVDVAPGYRRQGAGTALLEALLRQARAEGAVELAGSVAPGDEASYRFALTRGFRFEYQMLDGELDLAAFDPAPWADARLPEGIRITSLADTAETDQTAERLYDLDRRLSFDVPQWSGVMPPFTEYRAELMKEPAGVFIAWDEAGEMAGYSMAEREENGTAHTTFMGVLPAYRGRGIALALKLATIRWGQAEGLTRLLTNNNAASTAIVSLNEKLGFVMRPGPIYLVREV